MPFLLAMVVSMAWLPAFAKLATRWGVIDRPGGRKVHATPIPRIGGLAMVVGLFVAALVVIPLEPRDRWFLLAVAVLTLFGVLDDRLDLDYRVKFAGQLAAVLLVVFPGDIRVAAVTLDDRVLLPYALSVPLTVVFLVGITNAINLADGLDGLAGGTTFLCLAALALLAHGNGEPAVAALALAFAGAVLGFLRYNTFPASVFMGDAGSQVLGFAVGVLSLRATQGATSVVSAATPVLLLALPILDTLSVMVQRVSEGRSPFSADKNHIHHKLMALGFDHHEAVMVIYAVQADLFLLAYWLRYESDLTIAAVVSVFFGGAILLLQAALRHGWRFRGPPSTRAQAPLTRLLDRLRAPGVLPRWTYVTLAVAVFGYAGLVCFEAVRLSPDVEVLLEALLAVALVPLAVLRGKPLNVLERAALYVTVTVLVYIDSAVLPPDRPLAHWTWVAVGVAIVATVVRLRILPDRRFVLTPLDLIVLFVALVVPSLADSIALPDGGAAGIAKLVVLFYSLETLLTRTDAGFMWLRIAMSAVLAGLIVRPLLPL